MVKGKKKNWKPHHDLVISKSMLGHVAESVMFLTLDTCLTADPGVASSNLARSHLFVEIDRKIISAAILLPFAYSSRVVVSYKRKFVHKVLVNCLFKLAQEKSVVW